jgi:DNA-binding MarR family transcriptional regulator
MKGMSGRQETTAAARAESVPAQPAAPIARLAEEYIAVLVLSLASRLNRGATSYYLRHFDIGMTDFRIVMALGLVKGLNVGEVAAAADVDKAAASRSLKFLQSRGLVEMEQTATRGRAAIVHLTARGREFERELRKAARRRDRRLQAALTEAERIQAGRLMRKLIAGVPNMNKE